ncbi:glycosyltransferase family 39 protein [Streptomyces sp. NPDC026672]|uniref:ArnT family glycosyltransferase n=1 Tax=unclassified Streptomyces TaxID=2593676 RepID=UPI0033C3BFB5
MTEPDAPAGVPPLARGPVWGAAAAVTLLLLLVSNRFGYSGDELYFLVAGRHLDWGYADQPPLLPLLTHVMDVVFGGSPVALRTLPALLAGGSVVLTALTTREMGGRRNAQLLVAVASGLAPITLQSGHLFITNGVDIFFAMLSCWLLVRWVRLRDDRLLIALGAVVAVELQTKYLAVTFWAAVIVAVLVLGPRELLRRPKLWIGALIAVAVTLPSLIWQAQHDWPQLAVTRAITDEVATNNGGGFRMLLTVLGSAGLLGVLLLVHGLVRLFGLPKLRPYRFLGWAFVGIVVVYAVTGGRGYYAGSYFILPWAAAAADLQDRPAIKKRRWWIATPLVLVSLASIFTLLPVYPLSKLADTSDRVSMETVGWPEMADSVSDVYKAMPAADRSTTVILTDRYEQAAALDRYGPSRGLPPVYSGNRSYWYFGQPADTTRHVVFVGGDAAYLDKYFGSVSRKGRVDNRLGVDNINQGMPIWVCDDPKEPWSKLWPELRREAMIIEPGADADD